MVKFAKLTPEEREIVDAIVARAVLGGMYHDKLTAHMDITATHAHCPLRLAELRDADQLNFAHDMLGIRRHLNRQTGKLDNHFLPRFTAREDRES